MPNVLAYAETRGGDLRKAALEATTAARQIADKLGGEAHVLLAGPPGIAAKAEQLGKHGADVVIVVENPAFANFQRESVAATLAARAKSGGYRALILPFSAQGRDLGPRVAAKLDAPIASDVIAIDVQGDAFVVRHPGFANKVIITESVTGSPAVLTVRPSAFTPKENAKAGRTETMQPAVDPSAERVTVKEVIQGRAGRPDLGEATIIISGGRGLKAKENFALVEELADAFGNAAVGCTRAVADEGWRPQTEQIGQTGRVVSPQLYVAVGISGAIQHVAGMRTAKTIVAINKDKEAPIFKLADYGIVGDALEVVPALTKAVKEAKQH